MPWDEIQMGQCVELLDSLPDTSKTHFLDNGGAAPV